MAKDDKAVERAGEDAPFEIPPFNEKEFIRKELISFRTTLILFVISILSAAVTWYLYTQGILTSFFPLLALALAFGAVAVPLTYRAVKIDIRHFRRKEWFGTFALYFFFWLGFSLLLVNPPFHDGSGPQLEVAIAPAVQAPGRPVSIGVFASDNAGMADGQPVLCVHRVTGASPQRLEDLTDAERATCMSYPWEASPKGPYWSTQVQDANGSKFVLFAQATDRSGHRVEVRRDIEFGNPFSNVTLGRNGRIEQVGDYLHVKVHPLLRDQALAVQASFDGGVNWTNFDRHDNDMRAKEGWWSSEPSREGWRPGTLNVQLRVKVTPQWLGNQSDFKIGPADAYDPAASRSIEVVASYPDIGTTEPPGMPDPTFRDPSHSPGLELPVAIAVTVGLPLVRRRMRHA